MKLCWRRSGISNAVEPTRRLYPVARRDVVPITYGEEERGAVPLLAPTHCHSEEWGRSFYCVGRERSRAISFPAFSLHAFHVPRARLCPLLCTAPYRLPPNAATLTLFKQRHNAATSRRAVAHSLFTTCLLSAPASSSTLEAGVARPATPLCPRCSLNCQARNVEYTDLRAPNARRAQRAMRTSRTTATRACLAWSAAPSRALHAPYLLPASHLLRALPRYDVI